MQLCIPKCLAFIVVNFLGHGNDQLKIRIRRFKAVWFLIRAHDVIVKRWNWLICFKSSAEFATVRHPEYNQTHAISFLWLQLKSLPQILFELQLNLFFSIQLVLTLFFRQFLGFFFFHKSLDQLLLSFFFCLSHQFLLNFIFLLNSLLFQQKLLYFFTLLHLNLGLAWNWQTAKESIKKFVVIHHTLWQICLFPLKIRVCSTQFSVFIVRSGKQILKGWLSCQNLCICNGDNLVVAHSGKVKFDFAFLCDKMSICCLHHWNRKVESSN